MENKSQWVGIDVSKATLDVYLRPMGKAVKVTNNEEGITDLVGSPAYMVISIAYLNNWSKAEII